MRRSYDAISHQVAAMLKDDVRAHLEPRRPALALEGAPPLELDEDAARPTPRDYIEEREPRDEDASTGQLTAQPRGDVLEVSGVGPDGKRRVIKRIQLHTTHGNRQARRAALARARREK